MTRVRTVGWRLAHRFGGAGLRAWSLDDQYRRGRWDDLGSNRRPDVSGLVERLADDGFVVELGCGEGHLIRSVDPNTYTRYLGLDISQFAIDNARKDAPDNCTFEVQDLTTWTGVQGAKLIVSEESLYYLRPNARSALLAHCSQSIDADGSILVTFSDRHGHHDVIEQCCRHFPRHSIIDGPGSAVFLILQPDRRKDPSRR